MDDLIISAQNVYLRPLSHKDSEKLFSYRSNPEVSRYQSWKPVKLSETTNFIKKASFKKKLINNQWNQFAVCLHKTDEMVGDIGLRLMDHEAEIGFTIDPKYQRKGLAMESVTSLIKYLFQNHIVSRIHAYTDPDNIASINLLKKIGFIRGPSKISEYKENNDLCFILNLNKNLSE